MSTFVFPPEELLPRIGSRSHAESEFVEEGRAIKKCLERLTPPAHRLSPPSRTPRILDFGCGVGRLLNHFQDEAKTFEIWGCDLHEPSIAWLRKTFGSTMKFFVNRMEPPLPVENGYFDLVLGMSVFTHIPDWHAWLEEVARILHPGGTAILSFQSEIPYRRSHGHPSRLQAEGFVLCDADRTTEAGGPQIYQTPEWTAENWSRVLPVLGIFEGGLGGFQSVALLMKPPLPRPAREPYQAWPFVLTPETNDFQGQVDFDPWQANWWLSAGWSDRVASDLAGWLLPMRAPLECLEARIEGHGRVTIDPTAREDVGFAFPDVAWARECGFIIPGSELRALGPGAHRLRIDGTDAEGRTHFMKCQVNVSA